MKKDFKSVFYNLPRNIVNIFKGRNLVLHFVAIALTYFFVTSGFDWFYYLNTQNITLQKFLFPAAIIGGILPIILPIFLYAFGKIKHNRNTQIVAFALAQAGILALFISSFYKFFTGRVQPPFHSLTILDISKNFEFGFFRHGIFWGWPSSHTAVAFALAITLYILYGKKSSVKFLALLCAFYIGIGVSTNIHWFSDFVAGAIIGSVIGAVVGKSFLNKKNAV
jgi:membrane-associated phospholipid phosphatase